MLGSRLKCVKLSFKIKIVIKQLIYNRDTFQIWTEAREPEIGAVNFITGMGGFLQAIMFGYAGISIHLDKLEIANPQLIPDTTRLKINGTVTI